MPTIPKLNNQITAEGLLVIDEDGKNLGVLKRDDALRVAREKGRDLIEVSPLAQPPVARIMSFDKYRYQQERKLKKQRAAQKTHEVKQMQISGRIAANDLLVKARKVNEFLADGHPVNVVLTLRGREKGHQDWAHGKLQSFLSTIAPHRIIAPPRFMGRGIQTQIIGLK